MSQNTQPHQQANNLWSSRMTFILAAAGSAVGLGNIWKFPYITGENGGGAFVLVYLTCIFLIGVPAPMPKPLAVSSAGCSQIPGSCCCGTLCSWRLLCSSLVAAFAQGLRKP